VRNVLDKSCRENQNTHIVLSVSFFQRSPCLWDNVEMYGRARQATDDSIICCRHLACWVTKATDTHTQEYVILLFHSNKGYGNAPQCYVLCTLTFLLIQKWRGHSFIRYIMLFTLVSFLHNTIWRRLRHSKYIFRVFLYQAFISYRLLCCLHFSVYRIVLWKITSHPMRTVNSLKRRKYFKFCAYILLTDCINCHETFILAVLRGIMAELVSWQLSVPILIPNVCGEQFFLLFFQSFFFFSQIEFVWSNSEIWHFTNSVVVTSVKWYCVWLEKCDQNL
jgi:hypothetical protein